MATYVISDIHGCYEEYVELLEKLQLSNLDDLYILGDAMDRGPEPIKVMLDIISRPNVFYILGNHDALMFFALRLSEKGTAYAEEAYADWMQNGGNVTARQFQALPMEVQQEIWTYLEDAPAYDVVECGNKRFILAHAGIENFHEDKSLEDYDMEDFLWNRTDYGRKLFSNDRSFLVTGHTPTPLIRPDRRPLVYEENGHIAIDCGCVFGGALAAYCIETGQATYVPNKNNSPTASEMKAQ